MPSLGLLSHFSMWNRLDSTYFSHALKAGKRAATWGHHLDDWCGMYAPIFWPSYNDLSGDEPKRWFIYVEIARESSRKKAKSNLVLNPNSHIHICCALQSLPGPYPNHIGLFLQVTIDSFDS